MVEAENCYQQLEELLRNFKLARCSIVWRFQELLLVKKFRFF